MVRPIDLMIVGAQKAGTTSLIRYLGMHPKVCIHKQTELTFFLLDEEFGLGYDKAFKKYYCDCQDESSVIMAKNVGIMYWPDAVKRLKEHNPEMHLVAILRNPVDRAYSAYWFARRNGWESLETFEQGIDAEPIRLKEDTFKWRQCAYLDRGIYHRQIAFILEHFRRNQVHIFIFEDFKKNPDDVCRKIYNLFGLDSHSSINANSYYNKAAIARSEGIARFLNSDNPIKRFVRSLLRDDIAFFIKKKVKKINKKNFIPPPMNPETRMRLIEYFKEYNHTLGETIGFDSSPWNK